MVDDLDLETARAHITGRWGESMTVLDETSSTMDDADAAANAGVPDGHVILADRQTAGRGAHGRAWISPSGTDLYFSVVARPILEPSQVPLVTLATGLGVREVIANYLPDRRVTVKWPNDVWVDRRKCAGILVESKMTGERVDAVIIGIGVNVNRDAWPPELESIATSIRQERRGESLDRAKILAQVLRHVENWVIRLADEGAPPVVRALRSNLALCGRRVRWEDGEGVFEGIDDRGAALVRTDAQSITLHAARFEPLD